MLKSAAKLASLALALGVMSGCATNEVMEQDHLRLQELDKLVQAQSQKILQVEMTANNALAQAQHAHDAAVSAQAMAEKCNKACGAQMEKMFQKSMMK